MYLTPYFMIKNRMPDFTKWMIHISQLIHLLLYDLCLTGPGIDQELTERFQFNNTGQLIPLFQY